MGVDACIEDIEKFRCSHAAMQSRSELERESYCMLPSL